MRDNSRNIAVRMTEEQYQRLRRYCSLTLLDTTRYFRRLIAEDRMVGRPLSGKLDRHQGINMIHSNVMQIARNPRARKLDENSVEKLIFLANAICEQSYLLGSFR